MVEVSRNRNSRPYPLAFWGALLATFVVQTGFGAILPLLPQFVHHRGLPVADLGVMAAAYAAVSFVAQTGLGPLADIWGRKVFIVSGALLEALGTGGFLLHLTPPDYMELRIVQGLGSGAVIPAANALIADLVEESRRGRAYGLMAASSSAGFVIGPMLGGLAGAAFGLDAPFAVGLGLNLVAALVAWLTLPSLKTGTQRQKQPREAVLPLIGRLWPYFWMMFAWMGLTGMYDTAWSLYMQSLGAGKWLIGFSFTLFALPLLFFNVVGGRLADRGSRRHWIIILGALLQTSTLVVYVISRSLWLSISVSMIEAVAMSLTGPALSAAVMERIPVTQNGTVQGWFQASGTLGAAVLALSSGPLLPGHPNHPFVLGAAVLLATCIGVTIIWRPWKSSARTL